MGGAGSPRMPEMRTRSPPRSSKVGVLKSDTTSGFHTQVAPDGEVRSDPGFLRATPMTDAQINEVRNAQPPQPGQP